MMGNENNSSEQRIDRPCKKMKPIDAVGTQSGEETRDIPQEIVTEILVRLPVKSLLRFRCVAKSWLSLICSQSFIKTHLEFSTRDPNFSDYRLMLGVSYDQFHGYVNHGSVSSLVRDLLDGGIDDADGPDIQNDWRFEITGSYDGLLCVSVRHSFLSINHAFLWNPSLRMSKRLPPLPEAENGKIVSSIYGIVYDKPNDDYKVVGLFWGDLIVVGVLVEIYSLKNDSRKRITNSKGGIPTSRSPMVYANGKVHFLASFERDDLSIGTDIVSLDLENEVFGTVEQQPIHGPYGHHISLGVLKGCISAVYSYTDGYAYVCVLKEYGVEESWTNLVRIPYVYLPSIHNNYRPYRLCTVSNGKYLLGCGSRLVVYDPRDDSLVCSWKGNIDKICSTEIYVESLVSLPGMES